jgi:hypothetical protein
LGCIPKSGVSRSKDKNILCSSLSSTIFISEQVTDTILQNKSMGVCVI